MVIEISMVECVLVTILLESTKKKHINPITNRNNITNGCETCISVMLIQYYLNKLWLTQLSNFEKFSINVASTMVLQISKKFYD